MIYDHAYGGRIERGTSQNRRNKNKKTNDDTRLSAWIVWPDGSVLRYVVFRFNEPITYVSYAQRSEKGPEVGLVNARPRGL